VTTRDDCGEVWVESPGDVSSYQDAYDWQPVRVRTTWTCPTCWETVTVTSAGLGPAIIAAIENRHQHPEEDA